MAAPQYHYGRVSTIKDDSGNPMSLRVGPVPDPSGTKYRGARQANLSHVRRMVEKAQPGRITVYIYGRFYSGEKSFKWLAESFDRDQFLSDLTALENEKRTPEEAAQELFDYDNTPDLITAWEVRSAKPNQQ